MCLISHFPILVPPKVPKPEELVNNDQDHGKSQYM